MRRALEEAKEDGNVEAIEAAEAELQTQEADAHAMSGVVEQKTAAYVSVMEKYTDVEEARRQANEIVTWPGRREVASAWWWTPVTEDGTTPESL